MARIGLIGCGAIGTAIAEAIDNGQVTNSRLIAVFDVSSKNMSILMSKLRNKPEVYYDFEDFLSISDLDVVVEAASQEAVKDYMEKVVTAGINIMVMSVGAFLDHDLFTRIKNIAREKDCFVLIPSGAIGGLDVLKAAKLQGVEKVVLTTIKNPESLIDSSIFQEEFKKMGKISKPTLIFEGSAIEAVKAFPANVNVSATLSLCGIGGHKTAVRVIADPSVITNIHQVEVEGEFGKMRMRLENIRHPSNPKTSYLAILSAIEKLKSFTSKEVQIGT
jgi:aspartate dehydrogenase